MACCKIEESNANSFQIMILIYDSEYYSNIIKYKNYIYFEINVSLMNDYKL